MQWDHTQAEDLAPGFPKVRTVRGSLLHTCSGKGGINEEEVG